MEQGSSGDWTYRKWSSGFAECWIMGYLLTSPDTGYTLTNGMYITNNTVSYSTPFTFVGEANEFAILRNEVAYPAQIHRTASLTTTKTATYGVALHVEVTGWDMGHKFYIYRVGKWK